MPQVQGPVNTFDVSLIVGIIPLNILFVADDMTEGQGKGMKTETKWKIRGLEVQVPSARFLEELTEKMRLRLGDSGNVDAVITALFEVHFNIEEGMGPANMEHPGTVPGKTSYAISMDEAVALAKWLIERLREIRERSGIGRVRGEGG